MLKKSYRKLLFAVAAAAVLAMSLLAQAPKKFYSDDPLTVEPETQNAAQVTPWKIDLFYDLMLNGFTHPGDPVVQRARNVNTIDEVPDSSWFTNRIGTRPMSVDELVRGPLTGTGPAPGKWAVIRAKSDGAAPGFTVRDSAGVTWFLAFDPKSNPQGATGAAVVAMRIFWALGYHQAEYYISQLRPDQLTIDKEAVFDPPSSKTRPMRLSDIAPVLARASKNADGSYRVLASKLLPGKILGGFKYYGTRPDDPNDVIPHEHRRELRALHVFGAWANLVDVKALNTMDTLITENGKPRVRHYLLDIGSTFGIGANGPHDWTDGYEYLFDQDKALKRAATLGFYTQPWQKTPYQKNRSIGRFEGKKFKPELWKTRIPVGAVLRAQDDDNFWAARRVSAFSDDMIRALAKTGQYSDPAAEKLLGDVLIERRNRIREAYLPAINPLTNLALDGTGTLTFSNAAVEAGVAKAPSSYSAAWSVWNNSTGAAQAVGETSGNGNRIAAPAGLPSATGTYIVADVKAADSEHASWTKPVHATFLRTAAGWKLVGLERAITVPVTPTAKK